MRIKMLTDVVIHMSGRF